MKMIGLAQGRIRFCGLSRHAALVAGIDVLILLHCAAWMAGTSPATTMDGTRP
jgi:hypothetical protein